MIRPGSFLTVLLIASFSLGCTDESLEISNTPQIEFLSISPMEVVAYKEKVIIRIKYIDGDGDLGENNPDVKNLVVTDSRNQVGFQFRIPELAPPGSEIAITGELPIEMDGIALIDEEAPSELVSFSVQVTDRSGNQSNIVETSPITVSRE